MTEQAELLTQTIGETLKHAREQRGESIRDISRRMKLPRSILENIEGDRLEQLAPIYRRGYVLNYAQQLGLDTEPLREQLQQHEEQPPELREVLPTAVNPYRFERYLRVATYVFTTTLIVTPLVWFFVKTGADFFESYNNPEVATLVTDGDSVDGPREARRIRQALRIDNAKPGEPEDASHLRADIVPPLSIFFSSGGLTEQESIPPGTGPLLERERRKLAFHFIQTPFAINDDTAAISELVLSLREESWVEITDATGRRLEFNLLADGRHAYHGTPPFHLMLGRSRNVTVTLDGVPVDFSAHRHAQVARFDLMADGSSKN